jgi:hypothetical protein
VKQNLIPPDVPAADPWGQPFEGKSSKGDYELKCVGDPANPEEGKPFSIQPGRLGESSGPGAAAAPAGETPSTDAPASGGHK